MCIVNKIYQYESGGVCLHKRWRQLADGLSGYKKIAETSVPTNSFAAFAAADKKMVAVRFRVSGGYGMDVDVSMDVYYEDRFVATVSDIVDVDIWISTAKAIFDAFGVKKT